MKQGQRNIEMRPEFSRHREPCSKIAAKLRSRRHGKLENGEKMSTRLRKTANSSSSEGEISPRLFTSKQHVELVNFASQKIVPLLRKYSQNSEVKCEYDVKIGEVKILRDNRVQGFEREELDSKKIHKISNVQIENSDGKIDKSLNMMKNRSKNLFDYFFKEDLNESRSIGKIAESSNFKESLSKKEIKHCLKKELSKSRNLENHEINKRRSRSAPCAPLFKIKCSKDQFPRDLFVDRKSLADNEIREKIRKYRKNAPLSLRISRSGEVSVSSCEKSSNERITEQTSIQEPKQEEKLNEFILLTKNSQKFQPDEETKFVEDSAINKTTEEGTIESEQEKNKSEERTASKENSIDFSKDSEIYENKIDTPITNVEIEGEKNITSDEKIVETILPNLQNFVITREFVGEEHFSPQKFPKKREFKWETILEKQHRQLVSRSPEKCKETPKIIEKIADDKFKFWKAKTGSISKKNTCPRSRNLFEEKKLEAYSVIKKELPKLLMKRRNFDEIKDEKNDIEETTKNCRQIDKLNLPIFQKSSIDSRITERKSFERPERSNGKICRAKNSNFENSAEYCPVQKKKSLNVVKTQKNPKASILKRRKSPSPRRVTFSLPGRVIDDKSPQDKINFTKNLEDDEIELDNSKNHEKKIGDGSKCCEKNFQESLEEFTDKIENKEKIQNFRAKEKLRRHDRLLNFCMEEKARRFHAENSSNCQETKRFSIPPRFCAVEEQDNFCESEDAEQDWETPTSEDTYRASKDVKFPKETREAMKILLRAKENSVRCDHLDHGQDRITDRRGASQKREKNARTENLPVVSSYAEALDKFQESRDHDNHYQSFEVTTKQNRASRNANVAVGK